MLQRFVFIVIVFFLSGCAQIGTLSGGDKDVIPPKLVSSNPENGSTNFNEQKITLKFDEYVQLQNINNKLIISPPVKSLPKVIAKGKSVVFDFDTLFEENTTYSVFFDDAITDITERNATKTNRFVFSTGNEIDSLSVKGQLVNGLTLKSQPDFFVFLFRNLEDSVPLKSLPSYSSKTDKSGKFDLQYVRAGQYRLFAIKEINNNYLYDLPDEEIAFYDGVLNVDSNVSGITLFSFVEDNAKPKISTEEFYGTNAFTLAFNRKVDKNSITISDTSHLFSMEYYNGDSAVFWFEKSRKDTFQIIVNDSLIKDTITKVFRSSLKPKKLSFSLIKDLSNKQNPNKNLLLKANIPFKVLDSIKGELKVDSLVFPLILNRAGNDSIFFIKSDHKLKSNKSYQLAIYPYSIQSYEGDTITDTVKYVFDTESESYYGKLDVDLKVDKKNDYIFQLINSKGQVVFTNEFEGDKMKIALNSWNPDTYRARLILDENRNGKWDPGKYLKGQQSEKVFYYQEKIEVRSNWDFEIEWTLITE